MWKKSGFTIIEMILVIAIIAILASVAIRPLVRARRSGQESAAMQVLRSLRSAEVYHKTKYDTYGDLNSLYAMGASPVGEGAIDSASEYTITSVVGSESYTIVALPPRTEMRTYSLVDTGTLYGE